MIAEAPRVTKAMMSWATSSLGGGGTGANVSSKLDSELSIESAADPVMASMKLVYIYSQSVRTVHGKFQIVGRPAPESALPR